MAAPWCTEALSLGGLWGLWGDTQCTLHIVSVSLCRLTGTSTVTDQHLVGTDRDIPDPLFSGLLNKPSPPTDLSLFKHEAQSFIFNRVADFSYEMFGGLIATRQKR